MMVLILVPAARSLPLGLYATDRKSMVSSPNFLITLFVSASQICTGSLVAITAALRLSGLQASACTGRPNSNVV